MAMIILLVVYLIAIIKVMMIESHPGNFWSVWFTKVGLILVLFLLFMITVPAIS